MASAPFLDFTGQRLLVLGGTSGIGLATARLAADLGAEVHVASRSAQKVRAAVELIGAGARGAVLDLTDAAAVEAFFANAPAWDHVVVTGSDVSMAAVRELPLAQARQAVESKYWGFYHVARFANLRPGGSLSVVAGFLASRPVASRALMGSINAALEALVKGLALELRPVRVNAVSPGVVMTEMWSGLTDEARQAMVDKVSASYPAGRPGEADEIARQLLLLAATGYATGVIVTLDGGASIA